MSAISLEALPQGPNPRARTRNGAHGFWGGLPSEVGWRLQKSMSFPLRSFPHWRVLALSPRKALTVFRGGVLSPPLLPRP